MWCPIGVDILMLGYHYSRIICSTYTPTLLFVGHTHNS